MSQEQCPVCGKFTFSITRGEYDIPDESGAKQLSPDVGGCTSCGFYYQQHVRYPFEDQVRRYKNHLESKKKLERIIEEVFEPWISGEVKIENLRLPVRGLVSAILNDGFDELSLERVIDWWLRTYPEDVFVKQPEEIVAIREVMEKIKRKMEG